MSSTVAASSQKKPSRPRARRVGAFVAFAVFLLASAGLAYAVVSYGGVSAVGNLLRGIVVAGSGGDSNPPSSAAPSAPPTASVAATQTGSVPTPTVSASTTKSGLPREAQSAMYNQQLDSQESISQLLSGELSSLTFGTPAVEASSATIPVVGVHISGKRPHATATFLRSGSKWYFSGFSDTEQVGKQPFDSGVVAIITDEQARAKSQSALEALINGQIKSLHILSVSKGAGTATVYCRVTGTGPYSGDPCRFVAIRKASGGDTFWFLTRFSWD